MQILIEPGGIVRCLYGEAIELATLGPLQIARASHVEPTVDGQWLVPAERVVLLNTLYLPDGFTIGIRFTSSNVAAS